MPKYSLKILSACLIVFITSCTIEYDAQKIIDKTIANHGGEAYENSRIEFTFRGVEYVAEHQNGRFIYQRTLEESDSVIVDRLTNDGFRRIIDGSEVELSPEDSSSYANSVNSVIYFALLPYKLNDPAVIKEFLGKTTINEDPYYEIQVNFRQDGGGKDHEDTFLYWIHQDNHTMDFLAYRFHVNEGGTRFRESKNIRRIKGIRFADYNNFGGPEMDTPLEKYDELFMQDSLQKISEINLENIEVTLFDDSL